MKQNKKYKFDIKDYLYIIANIFIIILYLIQLG
jgi:hypothetical protein